MLRKLISLILCFSFLFTQSGFAQGVLELNLGQYLGQMSHNLAVDKFRPLHLRYLSYDLTTDNFQLLLDKGDNPDIKDHELEDKTKVLMEYFQIGLALPNEKFWVNLRPDAQDQIIDPELEKTDLGKVMLEADLQLKRDTANWTSPQTPEGRLYWDKLYQKARELFGTEPANIPTITRPWIVPGEIIVREGEASAYIFKANLKVMLEEDYLSSQPSAISSQQYNFHDPRMKELNTYSTQLIRELIIPKLTQEVNTAKRYAALRQVFFSLVLARWFKERFKGLSPKGTVPFLKLIDSGDLSNLTSKELWSKTHYFNEYKKSFEKGEYNLKEQVNTPTGQVIRSYVSGGIVVSSPLMKNLYRVVKDVVRDMGILYWNNMKQHAFMTLKLLDNGLSITDYPIDLLVRVFMPDKEAAAIANGFKDKVVNIFEQHHNRGSIYARTENENFKNMFRKKYLTPKEAIEDIRKAYNWIKETLTLRHLFRSNNLKLTEQDERAIINMGYIQAEDQIYGLGGSSPLTPEQQAHQIFLESLNQFLLQIETMLKKESAWYKDFSETLTNSKTIPEKDKMEIEELMKERHTSFQDIYSLLIKEMVVPLQLEVQLRITFSLSKEGIQSWSNIIGKVVSDLQKEPFAKEIYKEILDGWNLLDDSGDILAKYSEAVFINEILFNSLNELQEGLRRVTEKIDEINRGPSDKKSGSPLTIEQKIEVPTKVDKTGGIDFRSMQMLIQPMGSFRSLNLSLPSLSLSALERIDLDQELAALRNMVKAGKVPSGARVKEYLAACFQKGKIEEKQDDLLLCLAEIYRLQEEEVLETSPELRESLVIVDTGRFVLLPNNQKAGLN